MKTKIVVLISFFILFASNNTCIAGKTSFSGSASCFMPYQLELSEQTTQDTHQETQAPAVSGANGEYEVQKEVIPQEEKIIWNDNDMTQIEETTTCSSRNNSNISPSPDMKSEIILYTIYAR